MRTFCQSPLQPTIPTSFSICTFLIVSLIGATVTYLLQLKPERLQARDAGNIFALVSLDPLNRNNTLLQLVGMFRLSSFGLGSLFLCILLGSLLCFDRQCGGGSLEGLGRPDPVIHLLVVSLQPVLALLDSSSIFTVLRVMLELWNVGRVIEELGGTATG